MYQRCGVEGVQLAVRPCLNLQPCLARRPWYTKRPKVFPESLSRASSPSGSISGTMFPKFRRGSLKDLPSGSSTRDRTTISALDALVTVSVLPRKPSRLAFRALRMNCQMSPSLLFRLLFPVLRSCSVASEGRSSDSIPFDAASKAVREGEERPSFRCNNSNLELASCKTVCFVSGSETKRLA